MDALDAINQRRALRPRSGIDFASNDYLGFGGEAAFAEFVRAGRREGKDGTEFGAVGSRLLRGELAVHEESEARLADFCGRSAALLLPSGYQANIALLSALLQAGDTVYSDEFNHASLIDGMRLSGARKQIYRHADMADLRRLLEEDHEAMGRTDRNTGLKLIVSESLFSMDGDIAPLAALADLAEEFGAHLIVDEAHATGLYGDFATGNVGVQAGGAPRGGGLVQELGLTERVFATVHTGGKALGAAGAWIAGDPELKDTLVNFSRPFIFSTAVLPDLAQALARALRYWEIHGPDRARAVRDRAVSLRGALQEALAGHAGTPGEPAADTPIIPVILGTNERALAVADALQHAGFDARAIRPPTVPEGTARLRLTITWPVGDAELERLVAALRAVLPAV